MVLYLCTFMFVKALTASATNKNMIYNTLLGQTATFIVTYLFHHVTKKQLIHWLEQRTLVDTGSEVPEVP